MSAPSPPPHTHLSQAPEHAEEDALDAVGDELGAQATQEQALHALLLDDSLRGAGQRQVWCETGRGKQRKGSTDNYFKP